MSRLRCRTCTVKVRNVVAYCRVCENKKLKNPQPDLDVFRKFSKNDKRHGTGVLRKLHAALTQCARAMDLPPSEMLRLLSNKVMGAAAEHGACASSHMYPTILGILKRILLQLDNPDVVLQVRSQMLAFSMSDVQPAVADRVLRLCEVERYPTANAVGCALARVRKSRTRAFPEMLAEIPMVRLARSGMALTDAQKKGIGDVWRHYSHMICWKCEPLVCDA